MALIRSPNRPAASISRGRGVTAAEAFAAEAEVLSRGQFFLAARPITVVTREGESLYVRFADDNFTPGGTAYRVPLSLVERLVRERV